MSGSNTFNVKIIVKYEGVLNNGDSNSYSYRNHNDVEALQLAKKLGFDVKIITSEKKNVYQNAAYDMQYVDSEKLMDFIKVEKEDMPNIGINIFVYTSSSFMDVEVLDFFSYDNNDFFITPNNANMTIQSIADATTSSVCGEGVLLDVILFIINKFQMQPVCLENIMKVFKNAGF